MAQEPAGSPWGPLAGRFKCGERVGAVGTEGFGDGLGAGGLYEDRALFATDDRP